MAKIIPLRIGRVVKENISLDVTVKITGIWLYSLRLRLGMLLFKAAAFVIGCGIEFQDKNERR